MVSNGEIMTENEFKKSLPVEDQPGYNPDKDPNLLRRIKYYQGESLGADFDRAIEEEDKALKKLGRDPANILQRNRKVDPLVPKRATTKQMVELKGKIDKYKDVHFPKEEKPFTKIANNLGKNKKVEPVQLTFDFNKPKGQGAQTRRTRKTIRGNYQRSFRQKIETRTRSIRQRIWQRWNTRNLEARMNKYEIKYMLETMTSSVDRLTDSLGKQSLHIENLWHEIKEKQNLISSQRYEIKRLKEKLLEIFKQKHSEKLEEADWGKRFKEFVGESVDH